eukprot:665847-Amphidinium_carterae.1
MGALGSEVDAKGKGPCHFEVICGARNSLKLGGATSQTKAVRKHNDVINCCHQRPAGSALSLLPTMVDGRGCGSQGSPRDETNACNGLLTSVGLDTPQHCATARPQLTKRHSHAWKAYVSCETVSKAAAACLHRIMDT